MPELLGLASGVEPMQGRDELAQQIDRPAVAGLRRVNLPVLRSGPSDPRLPPGEVEVIPLECQDLAEPEAGSGEAEVTVCPTCSSPVYLLPGMDRGWGCRWCLPERWSQLEVLMAAYAMGLRISAVVAKADFGLPTSTADYLLCIYDANGGSAPAAASSTPSTAGFRGGRACSEGGSRRGPAIGSYGTATV